MQDHWEKNYIFCLLLYFDKKRTLFLYLLDFMLLNMVKMGITSVNNASAYIVHYIQTLISVCFHSNSLERKMCLVTKPIYK